MSEHRATAEVLNDLLDARTTQERRLHSAHDPGLAALVETFYTSDDAPAPPPELINEIWQDLTIVATNNKRHVPLLSTNGVPSEPSAERSWEDPWQRPRARRGHWSLSFLATAALVLLAFAGALLALQGTRPALDHPTESLHLPANSSAIAPVLVMKGRADTWPEANPLLWASLQRITFDQGETEAADRVVGDAAVLFTIEAGQLMVDASGPVTVTRGSNGSQFAPVMETAESPIQLEVGDTLFSPAGVTMSRSNVGSEPAVVLELRIAELEQTHRPENVHYLRLISDKVLNTPPVTPAELAVQRLELLPGESLGIGELPGLQMLIVESGSLELLGGYQLGNQSATGSDTVAAGSGQAHFDTTTGLANRGVEPTVFLAVTITPAQ